VHGGDFESGAAGTFLQISSSTTMLSRSRLSGDWFIDEAFSSFGRRRISSRIEVRMVKKFHGHRPPTWQFRFSASLLLHQGDASGELQTPRAPYKWQLNYQRGLNLWNYGKKYIYDLRSDSLLEHSFSLLESFQSLAWVFLTALIEGQPSYI
jgi:hypothetical protein